MASRKSPLFDTATTVGKIMSFLGVSALCGLLAAGLVFPLAATGGAAASAGGDILHEVPAELQEEPLSTPSHLYASDGETRIATFYAENRVPVDLEDVSQEMQDAIIAIEDERFYEHGGVDAQGVARAAVHNVTAATQQGASTLTMQYVNNVLNNAAVVSGEGNFLAAGIQEKTYADKLREMKLSVQVEQEMTKDEILEGYLNIVMLGGRNYGVEAAAQYYWGVSAAELDHQQAATLAGIVQAPNYFRPDIESNVEAAETRRNTVLRNMYVHDFITEDELDEAVASDLGDSLEIQSNEEGCIAGMEEARYFCDYAVQEYLQNDAFGETREEREELLARGGLRIVTTMDADMQRQAYETAMDYRPRGTGAVAVMNSIEPGTGNILSMAQSTNYDPDEASEDGSSTSMNFNASGSHNGGIGFPGGSVIKPFVAAAYIEEGGSMDDRIDASETEYEYGEQWEASCMDGGSVTLLPEDDEDAWEINNVIDAEAEMTVDWGLMRSINTATIATAYDMDLCAITEVTDRLGIEGYTTMDDDGYGGLRPDTPSFLLGSTTVTPLVMNRAYAAFANDGELCQERSILEVTDAHGNDYDVPGTNCDQVISPDVVAQVNDTMINIAEQNPYVFDVDGEAPFPMAGKTGTHESVSAMSFQGYTEGISTGAYIARPSDNASMWDAGNIPRDYAGDVVFPFWYDYMREVAPDRATGDFREANNSPFNERRSGWGERYAMSELGSGSGSSDNGDNDDDDDD